MSSISDETLMAYADGELDADTADVVERAMAADPALAVRVGEHRALREQVFGAFAPVLDEAVPVRLRAAAAGVVDLLAVRAKRERRWSWPEWGALAATLLVGVLAGTVGQRQAGDATLAADGALVARGQLAEALSQQLASGAPGAVKIGVSFLASDGSYCRSFVMGKGAGLACRRAGQWQLPVMAQAQAGAEGAYKQAANAMPAAVMEAIDARIQGAPLDAKAEQAARERGWSR